MSVLLREERAWLRRMWPVVLAVIVGCGVLAPAAAATASRHYEKVSPADKGQGDIVGDGLTTIAAQGGGAVAFNSRTPFGDTIGSGVSGQTQYLARRGATEWTTHAITPTPRADASQTFAGATKLQTFSDDLAKAIVWAYDLPAVDGDAARRTNIYQEDTATRSLRPLTVSQVDPLQPSDFFNQKVWGISADANHVAFVVDPQFPGAPVTQLLPEAAPGVPNVYQWNDGVLTLAGVLPDGSVPATGSNILSNDYRGAMSADGSRLAFTAASPSGGPDQLYLRIDGSRTVWVSQPEGSDQSDPTGVYLQAMTPDGHNVFFVTDAALLDEDTNPGPDIYRYTDSADPANDRNLTLVTNRGDLPGDPSSGGAVAGISADGEQVYWHTATAVLGVWDDSGASPVTNIISSDVSRDSTPTRRLSVLATQPGYGRVTPDGRYFAFATRATVDAGQVHGLTGEVTNGHYEMYLYRLDDNRLQCISCPSTDATADTTIAPTVTAGPVRLDNTGARPRFLSDRGQVFFSTPEALLPQDKNGVLDAYEYDSATGELRLLSSGTGSNPSGFADASANGDDVFFVTRQQLVRADDDGLVDMYDARVGPPLPEPPVTDAPPCDGDACQPPASLAPPEDLLGSLSFDAGSDAGSARGLSVRARAVFHGKTGVLRVRLLAAGELRWSGRGLHGGSVSRSRAGTYRLRLHLTKHARAHLKRTGSYTTTVRLTLVQADGTQTRGATRVTFRAAAKKGR